MSEKSKIAVFGGAFDPPHVGHAIYISNILNSNLVDQVWIVPSGAGRYDKQATASAQHRKRLVEIFVLSEFSADERVKLVCEQLDADANACATIELLDSFKKRFPQHEFFFVIGSDNVPKLSTWRESDRLLAENKFLVLEREPADSPDERSCFFYLKGEAIIKSNVSSSLVRQLIAKQKSLGGLVPSSVLQYIEDHKLYRQVLL